MPREISVPNASWRFLLLALAILIGGVLFTSAADASPAFGDDCRACHTDSSKLPPAHPPVANLPSAQCKACHTTGSGSAPVPARPGTAAQAQDQAQSRD